MRARWIAALGLAAWAAAATGSVETLLREVRAALAARQPDAEVARAIERAPLPERLDDAAIEELESEGAGPLAVEALERQRDVTRSLHAAAPAVLWADAPPAPSAEEQAALLAKAGSVAMHYRANLPNFLCTEEVRRYALVKAREWKALDTVTWEAGFAGQKERLRAVAVNGEPVGRRKVGGTTSSGEFGGVLGMVFDPQSQTKFEWSRWTRLRGRPAYVFSFAVDREHAQYGMNANGLVTSHQIVVGIRGQVYLDRETGDVVRLSYDPDGVPKGFAIRSGHTVVDYDWADIGGRKYLLPRRSAMRMVDTHGLTRNVTEFTNYRKFGSESSVTFGQ